MRNVIVGQSGGPTAAINATLAGVLDAAHAMGFDTVYGMRYGIEGLLADDVIDLSAHVQSPFDVELLKRTPSSFLGSCRYKLPPIGEDDEVYVALFEKFAALDIACVIYIGGNDSMDTVLKLSRWAEMTGSSVKFIGAPKTIDNALAKTDHTPGEGSAAKYVASTVRELVRDSRVYHLKSVTVVEIMGRNAGWLTAAAALAKGRDCEGADLILLPEVAFHMEAFLARVKALTDEKGSIVVAVSEGIRTADGTYVCENEASLSADVFGHKNLTGTAQTLARVIKEQLGIKTRAVELNTLQRCAAHCASATDLAESYACGSAAVVAACNGFTGKLAALVRTSNVPYLCVPKLADIAKVANEEKCVPIEWIAQDGFSVTQDFIDYALPLIQGEVSPIYENGVPKHLVLDVTI